MALKISARLAGTSGEKCCCEGCCMYPADQYGVLYFDADLPEISLFLGVSPGGSDVKVAISFSDGAYPLPSDMFNEGERIYPTSEGWVAYLLVWDSELEDDVWREFNIGNCLIGASVPGRGLEGDNAEIQDQFEAEYTISGIGDDPDVTVARESLCVWSGQDACGNTWYLTYGTGTQIASGLECGWNVKAWTQPEDCGLAEAFLGSKTGNQDTPAGDYDGTYTGSVS